MSLQSPTDYLRRKEESILPDDDTDNSEFLDPQDLASEDGDAGVSFDDERMGDGRTVDAKSSYSVPDPPEINSQQPYVLPSGMTHPNPAAPAGSASAPLDPSGYNAASQRVADITGQRPAPPQPKWWQRLAAGAVGGLAGFSNAQGKRGPQIDPSAAEDTIMGGPGYRRQLGDWNRQLEGATAQQKMEAGKLSTLEAIQKSNAEKQLREIQMKAAEARLAKMGAASPGYKQRFDDAKAAGATDEQAHVYASGGHITPPKPSNSKGIEITPEAGKQYGLMPDADGKYYLPPNASGSIVRATSQPDKPEKPPETKVVGHQLYERQENGMWKKVAEAPVREPGAEKPASHSQFRLIEDEKQRDLQKAEITARKRIKGDANNEPEDPQSVAADLASDKQRIQNAYEAKIEAAGGHAQHLDVNAPPAQAQTPPPQQTQKPQQWQYRGQTITMGQTVMVNGKPHRVVGFQNGKPQVQPL